MLAPVPDRLARSLACVPPNAPCVLLVRHADRHEIPDGGSGHDVPLTDVGFARAAALGTWLRDRSSVGADVSPLLRCVQTAEHALHGLPAQEPAVATNLLGAPGPFVVDGARCSRHFTERGTPGVVRALLAGEPLAGMRSAQDATVLVVRHVRVRLDLGGTRLLVSHDAIVMPIIHHLCGESFDGSWLDPLDGIAFTLDRGRLAVWWNGVQSEVGP